MGQSERCTCLLSCTHVSQRDCQLLLIKVDDGRSPYYIDAGYGRY